MSGSRPTLAGALTAAAMLLSACGGALPEESGPSGVDGLVIPTPSADADDFVAVVDNPWLPLVPGATWRYRSGAGASRTVTVTDEDREVQGVAATVVEDTVSDPDGDVVVTTSSWYAQDDEGNVWRFGQERTAYDGRGRARQEGSWAWEAGADGAQAGVAMLADPRVGDGYRQEYAPGTAEDHATVLSVDATAQVGPDGRSGLVLTEDVSSLDPAIVVLRYYERGTGLVVEETINGDPLRWELVAHDPA